MRTVSVLLMLLLLPQALANGWRCDPAVTDPVVLVIGDSLSAGYGIDLDEGLVALLQERLDGNGEDYRVVNASVSGDTTAGGLARLDRALEVHKPRLVVIELGGNDGLRGLPLSVVRKNFQSMIETSRGAGAEVAMLGMRIPTNYGRRYAEKFHDLYLDLADKHDLPVVDFFLDGVALDDALMQADGIHPNADAQPRLLDNAWPAIEAGLARCQ